MPKSDSHKDKDDDTAEDGVLFYINKSGFPIDEPTWDRMWTYVAKLHPEGHSMVKKIRGQLDLPEIRHPTPPSEFPLNTPVDDRLSAIQDYMLELNYNHTGTQFYEIKKYRPLSGLMETAKEMIREALPIKCLEAVILGIYLSNGIANLDRYSIGFKTVFNGRVYRHVVLGVTYCGRYGALGMSRRKDLMFKPLGFKSLSSLVIDFKNAYEKYFHEVKKIKVGMPIPHDSHSYETINWKRLSLSVPKMKIEDLTRELDKHSREMRSQPKPPLPLEARKSNRSPEPKSPSKHMRSVKKSESQGGSKEDDAPRSKRPNMTNLGDYQIRV